MSDPGSINQQLFTDSPPIFLTVLGMQGVKRRSQGVSPVKELEVEFGGRHPTAYILKPKHNSVVISPFGVARIKCTQKT